MKFFSGFALSNDKYLCEKYLINSEFNVAGLSFGSIKAIEYAKSATTRIDTLQLFSPAFFQDRDEKFRRMQLMYFAKNEHKYIKEFILNCFYPQEIDNRLKIKVAKKEELEKLLNYTYDIHDLLELKSRGISIEIHLGSLDKIINSANVRKFFIKYCDVFLYKNSGHFLA